MNIYVDAVEVLTMLILITTGLILIAVPLYFLLDKYFDWIFKIFNK